MPIICRCPGNPLKALIAFVSGLIGGLNIGKGISDHSKWMNEGCIVSDNTDTEETDDDVPEGEIQKDPDELS